MYNKHTGSIRDCVSYIFHSISSSKLNGFNLGQLFAYKPCKFGGSTGKDSSLGQSLKDKFCNIERLIMHWAGGLTKLLPLRSKSCNNDKEPRSLGNDSSLRSR